MPEKKYVLVVTYYFPPAGGPGVQRVLKFLKYLGEFGWTPIVLVPENPEYPAQDESLLKELPADLIVRRAPIFEPYDLYRKFTGKQAGVPIDVNVNKEAGAKRSMSEKVAEFIRATIFIPDARIGWLLSAVKEGRQILKEYPVRAIYSSSPPYTPSLVARRLHRISKIPWVAGFRDPWTGFLSTPERWAIPRAIDRSLEKSVFTEANLVEVAWNGITRDIRGKYPELPTEKFIHIPNGFDGADFPEPDITKRAVLSKNEKCTITYSGSLYGPRNPRSFLQAVEMLIVRKKIDPEKMRLRFVGRFGAPIHDMLDAPAVRPMIEKIEYVAHARAVELLLDSDALLLIVDDVASVSEIVPGKVYEYLGAARPIMAIAPPEGAIGDLLRETNAGETVRQSDMEGQARIIKRIYDDWLNGESSFAMKLDTISQYERREATRKLAGLFDRLTQ